MPVIIFIDPDVLESDLCCCSWDVEISQTIELVPLVLRHHAAFCRGFYPLDYIPNSNGQTAVLRAHILPTDRVESVRDILPLLRDMYAPMKGDSFPLEAYIAYMLCDDDEEGSPPHVCDRLTPAQQSMLKNKHEKFGNTKIILLPKILTNHVLNHLDDSLVSSPPAQLSLPRILYEGVWPFP